MDANTKVEWSISGGVCAKDVFLYDTKAYGGYKPTLFLTSTLDISREPHAPPDIHPEKEHEYPIPVNDEEW